MNKASAIRAEASLASSIEIDMEVSRHPELVELWGEWCGWRSDLALSEKSKPWTVRGARMEMRNMAVAIGQGITPEQIAAQIRKAITGCWVGMNLDHIRQPQGMTRAPDAYRSQFV